MVIYQLIQPGSKDYWEFWTINLLNFVQTLNANVSLQHSPVSDSMIETMHNLSKEIFSYAYSW